ncbi:NADP-dependent oxidoreductase [Streptomyces sp. AM8-1-1]|uniref:NADP-dependent oxidoreductase n=1 Tax=Streptomyces sp. AM8-1-1 TaxID=3075825 RepID=UPI0028C3B4BE|nr:NADP-dependent oxidoreductase [Streptomyces sp. AM8-1-1]WNO70546.1 NADP-dependent oxidoreductase [Streptomyces sp. AM8-1-1]
MRALVAPDYVPLDQVAVTEHPTPTPGPDQVLVKVEAAALNPLDLMLITGAAKESYPADHPLVVGMDAAGTVVEVGENVTRYSAGDPVLVFTGGGAGAVAEYTVASSGPLLARRPAGLDSQHAAAIPESGLTAVNLLRAVRPTADGRRECAGDRGDRRYRHVRRAARPRDRIPRDRHVDRGGRGVSAWPRCDDTVDYRRTDVVEEVLRLVPGGVDVVIDLVNSGDGLAGTARAARPGGRLVSPLYGPADLGRDVESVYIGSFQAQPGELDDLAARAADGRLQVEIGARYPFANAAQAVNDFATQHIRGKVVVTFP